MYFLVLYFFVSTFCLSQQKTTESYYIFKNHEHDAGVTESESRNVVTVPYNCPTGQYMGADGICRDVWRQGSDNESELRNVVTVPYNCPQGNMGADGACHDVWRLGSTA